jgi:DNA-binding transcriptional MerR regulator
MVLGMPHAAAENSAPPLDPPSLRIGEVASRLRTTPRTIRYYEEIGLLPSGEGRSGGAHRCYSETEVERIAEILRLKELLGLSLESVRGILEADEARRLLSERYTRTTDAGEQTRILADLLSHIERQLELVSERQTELSQLADELSSKRRRVKELMETLQERA